MDVFSCRVVLNIKSVHSPCDQAEYQTMSLYVMTHMHMCACNYYADTSASAAEVLQQQTAAASMSHRNNRVESYSQHKHILRMPLYLLDLLEFPRERRITIFQYYFAFNYVHGNNATL